MLARFAFVISAMQAVALADDQNTGIQQSLTLYDDDGYILDITYATVRETLSDCTPSDTTVCETSYMTIALTG